MIRQTIWKALLLLGAVVGWTGCADEHFRIESASGEKDVIELGIDYIPYREVNVGSRSAADEVAESKVEDLLILIFGHKNGNSRLIQADLIQRADFTQGVANGTDANRIHSQKYRKDDLKSKYEYSANSNLTFVVFANSNLKGQDWTTGDGRDLYSVMREEVAKGNNSVTLSNFKTWNFYLVDRRGDTDNDPPFRSATTYEGVTERSTEAFLMWDMLENQNVEITEQEASTIRLNLKRMDAKIEFNIKPSGEKQNLTVFPKRWRVHKVPVTTSVMGGQATESYYYEPEDMVWRDFDRVTDVTGTPVLVPTGKDISSFTFYMPTNIQTAKKNIDEAAWRSENNISFAYTPTIWQKYGLRTRLEKTPPTTSVENPKLQYDTKTGIYYYDGRSIINGAFKYAPENATWVEFLCNIYEKDGYKTKTSENVIIRVMLGAAKNASGEFVSDMNQANLNDYSVESNNFYKYNVTVGGLDDIEVEVKANEISGYQTYEDNPMIDGHVSVGSFAQMDSHFDAKAILINYDDLISKYGDARNWNVDDDPLSRIEVSTPYDFVGVDPSWGGKRDISWVSFFIHPRTSYFGVDMIPRFTLPYEFVRMQFPESNSAYKKLYQKNPVDLVRYLRTAVKAISNATDQRAALREWGFDPDTKDMIITVYVNEFYYETRPEWVSRTIQTATGGVALTDQNWANNGWRTFVNQPDRKLRLRLGDHVPQYSSDGYSSWSDADIVISQHSIMAPYNLNLLPVDFVGFGAESVDEADWMDHAPNGRNVRGTYCKVFEGSDYMSFQGERNIYDGRSLYLSMLNDGWIIGRRWTDLIDYKFEKGINLVPKTNEKGRLYQDQMVFYKTVYALNSWSMGDWAGVGPIARNRELTEINNMQSATISQNELRWYLPSLPQLEYLWMAEAALSPAYRLREDIPYLTSSRADNATNQNATEGVMFDAHTGGTLRQRIVKATAGLLYPLAWSVGDAAKAYYYGYSTEFNGWGRQQTNKPLRIRAVRTLGNYSYARIFRPAQRWISNSGNFSDDTELVSDYTQIVIDCSRMPSQMLRSTPIKWGGLPKHDIHSVWARPYKAFRVAKASVQVAKNLNGWNWHEWGYDDVILGKWTFPKRNMQQEPQFGASSATSKPELVMDDSRYEHPCRNYVEYRNGKEISGWRLPNAQELMLMIRLIPPQHLLDLRTRHWGPTWQNAANGYAKGSGRNWSSNNNPTSDRRIETLSNSEYNPAYLMSKTETAEGYRFYGGSFWSYIYGFRAQPMDTKRWSESELIRMTGGAIYDTRFDVRCVKDVTDGELSSLPNESFIRDYWVLPN